MWLCRYLTMVFFAALPLQAQQCPPNGEREVFHRGWSYTAHYREKQRPELEAVSVLAEDSHGRFLNRYTRADGDSSSTVYDPVAEQEAHWDTGSMKVKIVKYSMPVEGQRTCWRSPWSERFCAPAGEAQGAFCRDACYAERLAKAPPPEKKGFTKCDAPPGGTAEDLGMSAIQGIAAHGCRLTAPSSLGGANIITENWFDEYGLSLRIIIDSPSGNRFLKELISLSRDEPDVSTFRPPSGYAVVMQEAEEVTCKPMTAPLLEIGR